MHLATLRACNTLPALLLKRMPFSVSLLNLWADAADSAMAIAVELIPDLFKFISIR